MLQRFLKLFFTQAIIILKLAKISWKCIVLPWSPPVWNKSLLEAGSDRMYWRSGTRSWGWGWVGKLGSGEWYSPPFAGRGAVHSYKQGPWFVSAATFRSLSHQSLAYCKVLRKCRALWPGRDHWLWKWTASTGPAEHAEIEQRGAGVAHLSAPALWEVGVRFWMLEGGSSQGLPQAYNYPLGDWSQDWIFFGWRTRWIEVMLSWFWPWLLY